MIPPVFHQTWKSRRLPESAARLRDGWIKLNPSLEHRLYDDDDCSRIFSAIFPGYASAFNSLELPILRADLFRYAILWSEGGIYADIDMECLRPIERLLQHHRSILSVEAHLTRKRQVELGYEHPIQIANCIMAAPPQQPLFRDLVSHAFGLLSECQSRHEKQVEDLTGPRMLTRFVYSRPEHAITLLPQIILMAPLHYPFVFPLSRNMYARHRTFGSWKKSSEAPWSLRRKIIERNKWPSPFPSLTLEEG